MNNQETKDDRLAGWRLRVGAKKSQILALTL
jgi:hypothetical protein